MKYNPQVSVVIPAYNAERYIGQAINSILKQSYKNYEIIVVDDGSTDRTAQVITRFPMVKYIYQQNKRCAAARNTGIKHANGELIAFLDADDLWTFDHLELAINLFRKNPDIGFVGGSYVVFNDDLNILNIKQKSINEIGKIFFDIFISAEPLFQTSTWVVKKEILETVGFFKENVGMPGEDYELLLRITYSSLSGYLNKPTVFYREHQNNIMKRLITNYFYDLKKSYLSSDRKLMKCWGRAEAAIFAGLGYNSLLYGCKIKALKNFIKAIMKAPTSNPSGKLYPYIGIIKIIFPSELFELIKTKSLRTLILPDEVLRDWKKLKEEIFSLKECL